MLGFVDCNDGLVGLSEPKQDDLTGIDIAVTSVTYQEKELREEMIITITK